jgi:titin
MMVLRSDRAWEKADNDGGAPVKSYTVEKRDITKKNFIKAGNTGAGELELKVTKLIEGKEYNFNVFAENEIGQSLPAFLSEPVKSRLPFGEFLRR